VFIIITIVIVIEVTHRHDPSKDGGYFESSMERRRKSGKGGYKERKVEIMMKPITNE
jgi:hypothetical protein